MCTFFSTRRVYVCRRQDKSDAFVQYDLYNIIIAMKFRPTAQMQMSYCFYKKKKSIKVQSSNIFTSLLTLYFECKAGKFFIHCHSYLWFAQ